MNRVIIVEGPNGAGKSTLCEKIAAHWPKTRVVHEGPPPAEVDKLEYYGGKLLAYLSEDEPVVLDRFHIGETIYGPVCRGVDELGTRGRTLIDRLLTAYGVRCIIALPPYEVVLENWLNSQKRQVVRSEQQLWEIYCRFWAVSPLYEVYNYTRRQTLKFNDDNKMVLPLGAAGSLTAKFLFVGQVSNGSFDLPFFSLRDSSRLLNSCLDEAGFMEHELAFVNAQRLHNHTTYNLAKLAAALPKLRCVVALGDVANRHCKEQLVKYPLIHLTHPAHQRRFLAGQERDYVEQLLKIRETYDGVA